MEIGQRLRPVGLGILGVLGVLLAWQLVRATDAIPANSLPGPVPVLRRVPELLGAADFRNGLLDTIRTWALALVLSTLVGVVIGVLAKATPGLAAPTAIAVDAFRSVPSTALIPIAILPWGLGTEMKVAVAMYAIIWPILINTVYGLSGVEPMRIDAARSMRSSWLRTQLYVSLPTALPSIFTGIRIASGSALVVVNSTELLGAQAGAGTVLVSYQQAGRLRALVRPVLNLWLLAAVLLIWECYARAHRTIYFPPLSAIFGQFRRDWLSSSPSHIFASDQFWHTVAPSVSRLFRAFVLALVFGVGGGVLVARNSIIRGMYNPMIRFWMATPKVVLLPIALQLFGVSDSLNIFVIFFGIVWLIMVNTADCVSGVHESWLRSARSIRLSRRALYLRVILPAAAPQIMAGIRVSIGVGLTMVIISEFYATTAGLGYQVLQYQETFRYPQMWSAFLLIAIIGLILNLAAARLERRALRWQRRTGLGAL